MALARRLDARRRTNRNPLAEPAHTARDRLNVTRALIQMRDESDRIAGKHPMDFGGRCPRRRPYGLAGSLKGSRPAQRA